MITAASEDGYQRAADGVERKTLVHGERTLMVRFRLAAGSGLPPHSHPHEQTGYLVSGRARFTVGGDTTGSDTVGGDTAGGETTEVGPGDSWCIPGGVEHSLVVLEDSVAVEVFSPVREAYLP